MGRLAEWSLRRPRLVLAGLLLATAALAAGLLRLETEAGYRAYLGAEHPAIRKLDAFAARFGGGLPFAVVWGCAESPACEDVFEPAPLEMAHGVARLMEAVPGVARVDGPATSPLLAAPAIGLPEARRLAPEGDPAPDLRALAARAVRDPTWVGQLVSADGRAGAIVIQLASSEPEVGVRALQALRGALARYEDEGFRFHLVGGPVEFVVAGGELARATVEVVPVMLALVALVLLVLFRRPGAALASLAGVGVAVVWTLGLLGWLGWPQTTLTQVLAPLVLVIGVCDSIHLLTAYAARLPRFGVPQQAERRIALGDAARAVGKPCLFTTLTTAAGLLSFRASELESFARFGTIAAWGVAAALLLTFTLVPLLAVRLPSGWVTSMPSEATWTRALDFVARISPRGARAILWGALAAGLAGAGGLLKLEVDARFEDLYGEESQVVRWVRGAQRHLREAETLEIALELPEGVGVDDVRALGVLAALEPLAGLDGLGRPLSILTPMRELHRALHGSELALGEGGDPQRASRTFRLLRGEAPGTAALFADAEGGALRLSLQAGKLPQARLRGLLAEVDAFAASVAPEGYGVVVTGPLATVGVMIDAIRHTQLASLTLAGGLVLALVVVFFQSFAIGAMALVPTALPVMVTLGAMGWLGIALDVGSAMVAAVVLGLAVDDAIHLLDAYDRRRRWGIAPRDSLAWAVREVGRALVTTSLALTAGFGALALSPWRTVASFGAVAAIAIAGALVAVLLVLPAILVVLRPAGTDGEVG